ncbi:hypothetical protein JAO73_18335 [Hymenobacter sp. BT523]|nr:hypothetical protein [Hymenobacter sp. BT523]
MLAGCESRNTARTAEQTSKVQPVSAKTEQLAVDQNSASDTIDLTQTQPSGNVSKLHEIAFEEKKVLASGLLVVIKSIHQPDSAIIRDPFDVKVTFSILQNHKVIYQDTANGMTYDFDEQPVINTLYPLWIPTGKTAGELLVAFDNRPSKELARRFYIKDGRVAKIDTLLTFDGPAKDYDKDGKLEFAGFYDFGEEWDDDKGRHRQMYVPTLYYEIMPNGLQLDSVLTEKQARADYGAFLGFKDSSQPGILTSKLPKGSKYRR